MKPEFERPLERVAYSIKEGAEAIGISERFFREFIYSGKLPTRQLGARRLVLKTDLEAFVQSLPVSQETATI